MMVLKSYDDNLSRRRKFTGCSPKMPPWQYLTSEILKILTRGCNCFNGDNNEDDGVLLFRENKIHPIINNTRQKVLKILIRGKQSEIRKVLQNFPGHDLGNRYLLIFHIIHTLMCFISGSLL